MLTKLKKQVQVLLTTETTYAHRIGLTPNAVSGIGIILALISALAYWLASENILLLVLAALLLLFSGFCDALDGALARAYGQTTIFGGFLDSVLDRYADAAVFVGIVLGGFADFSWGLIAIVGSLLVSYVRARAEAAGVKMESIGIAERAERVLILFVASLAAIFWVYALWWGVVVLAFLTNATVVQRVAYFHRAVKKKTAI